MSFPFTWPSTSRFLVQQGCEPEEGGGDGRGGAAAARRRGWRSGPLRLRPPGREEALQEVHVLHLQGQGVRVLLPPGHHLDQHARVRAILAHVAFGVAIALPW